MARVLSVAEERFPIAGTFTISRGSKTEAEVITCTIAEGENSGRGECVPYRRYGETMESVRRRDRSTRRPSLPAGIDRDGLLGAMKPGAARNAVDCALWDLEAKISGIRVAERLGNASPAPLETAYTLSLGTPEAMAAQARDNAARPLLKVKIGGDGDIARIRAVREAAPAQPHHPRRQRRLDRRQHQRKPRRRGRTRRRAGRAAAARRRGRDSAPDRAPGAGLRRRERAHGRRARRAGRPLRRGQHQARQGGRADGRPAPARRARANLASASWSAAWSAPRSPWRRRCCLAQGADFVDLDGPLLLARDRAARPYLSRFAGVTARACAVGLSMIPNRRTASAKSAKRFSEKIMLKQNSWSEVTEGSFRSASAAATISPSPTRAITAIT